MYTKNKNIKIDQKLKQNLNKVQKLDMTQIHNKNKYKCKSLKDRSQSTNIDAQKNNSYFNPIKFHLDSFRNKQDNEIITNRLNSVELNQIKH